MVRAHFRLVRRILTAVILLGLLVCGAEVGVRIFEVVQGHSICSCADEPCLVDPSGLAVPSWLTDRELKPHSTAEIKCRDRRRIVEFKTNSLGLRGFEPAVPKPTDTYRVVILGDETILAPEIPDDELFSNLLAGLIQQQTRPRVEVINAGIPGACPLTEYILFKQKLLALQPDLVLLHFDWSDVCDDRQLRRQTRCDTDRQPLSCPHPSLTAKARKPNPIATLRQQFRLVDWGLVLIGKHWKNQIAEQTANSRDVGANSYAWLRKEHLENDVNVGQSMRPIEDLARLARGSFFQLVLITSPKPWQVSARCTNGSGVRLKSGVAVDAFYSSRAPFEMLAATAASVKIPYFDLSPALVKSANPEANFLRYAPRWSPEGHRSVAKYLAKFLMTQVPGPWNSPYFQQRENEFGNRSNVSSGVQWASGNQRGAIVE